MSGSPIILLSKDLLFITKIREVVHAAGCELLVVKSDATLESRWQELSTGSVVGGLMMIDLEKPGVELSNIAKVWTGLASLEWRCLSFFSHVHESVAEQAQALGLGDIMPRSRFIRVLPDILRSL